MWLRSEISSRVSPVARRARRMSEIVSGDGFGRNARRRPVPAPSCTASSWTSALPCAVNSGGRRSRREAVVACASRATSARTVPSGSSEAKRESASAKLSSEGYGRQIERAERTGEHQPKRSRDVQVRGRVEGRQQRVEQMGRSRHGPAIGRHGAFDRDQSRRQTGG